MTPRVWQPSVHPCSVTSIAYCHVTKRSGSAGPAGHGGATDEAPPLYYVGVPVYWLMGLSEQPPRLVTPNDATFPWVQRPRVYGSLACLISQCCRQRVERTATRVIDQPPRWVAHSSHMPMGTADRTCPNQHAKTQAQGPGSQAKTPKAHPGRMHRCGGSPLLAAFPGRARFRATPRRLPGSRA